LKQKKFNDESSDASVLMFERTDELVKCYRTDYIDGSEYEYKTLYKIDMQGDLVRLDMNLKWQKILGT